MRHLAMMRRRRNRRPLCLLLVLFLWETNQGSQRSEAYAPRPSLWPHSTLDQSMVTETTQQCKEDGKATTPEEEEHQLHRRIHDLQHQIDLLPTDFFFHNQHDDSPIPTQHDHFRRLVAAHHNATLYYADQLSRVRHQLKVANRHHRNVATTLTQLTVDNAILRERLQRYEKQQQQQQQTTSLDTQQEEEEERIVVTHHRTAAPVSVVAKEDSDDRNSASSCVQLSKRNPSYAHNRGDLPSSTALFAAMDQLEHEKKHLRKTVLVLLRLLLHR